MPAPAAAHHGGPRRHVVGVRVRVHGRVGVVGGRRVRVVHVHRVRVGVEAPLVVDGGVPAAAAAAAGACGGLGLGL